MTTELRIGDYVQCGFFVGRIADIATSERRIMLLVDSPKAIWRNHGPEWIEYDPDTVRVATAEQYNAEVERYRKQVEKTLTQLKTMKASSAAVE
jgi:hypothetical protein